MLDPEDIHNIIIEFEARIEQLETRKPSMRVFFDGDPEVRKVVEKIANSKEGECIPLSRREMQIVSDPAKVFVIRSD
jgi:hypothetical protein